jgi:predicted DCC family thiol-disulfide oxidoreductase YuxK
MMPSGLEAKPVLLWDGQCGLCARAAHWVTSRDATGCLEVRPYQSVPSPPMTPALRQACGEAVHLWMPDGRVLRAGRASMAVLELLGWRVIPWHGMRRPFVWGVELVYGIVARHRIFFSKLLFRRQHDLRNAK